MQGVLNMLVRGKNLALVTDAGTPGISDPGNELVAFLLGKQPDMRVVPIPGPSALSTLASVAGIPMDKFVFLGYPPHKKGRKKFFEEVVQSAHPAIFYESPYRVIKSLTELQELQTTNYKLQTVVGRELTKKFETVYRGTLQEILEQFKQEKPRGEFAVLVSK